MIPGANLLNIALGVIGSQSVVYSRWLGRATNAGGFDVDTYADPVTITRGSVQPIDRRAYQQLGLDMSKKYVTWITQTAALGVNRDYSGDKFTFAGETFKIESDTNWQAQDGWSRLICVRVVANA